MSKISTYAEAGVDRKLEEKSVNALLNTIKSNLKHTTESTADGLFAGGIDIGDNVLSLATDGVGSKILLAEELGIYNTVGIDCVAMNVNDLLASGSIPAAFVDYIAIREPDSEKVSAIVEGVVEGCNQSEIPLVGGETAILPELIQGPANHFDLAGTALGISSKSKPFLDKNIEERNVVLGIESSGVHSNGFTLARKFFNEHEIELKKMLLTPTRIYVNCIKECVANDVIFHGMAHITGGGLRNLLRLGNYHFQLENWEIPSIFKEIQQRGSIELKEMFTTFNMGIGYMLIISEDDVPKVKSIIERYYPVKRIGVVKNSDKPLVTIGDLEFGESI